MREIAVFETRSTVLAMLRASIQHDETAWAQLVPQTGEKWAEIAMQALSLLRGALDNAPDGPLAELNRLNALLLSWEASNG
ncbi:hypothetical protein CQ018_13735 [Arthrobacter sp. MYb227]|uniref:hypothetical protein n=1 Tax=Arthrobacter sp. MYb227 TaxID=1848601 RepID=UPI000CFD4FFA|nr:hypothetical protein [Arthrobacter sp. MYb227]PQZ91685.1 hypothetical protein CQ018_13735 [Arthrobacter sp. MYb227]